MSGLKDGSTFTVVVAEDDEDDRLMVARAWELSRIVNPLVFVNDGEELMDYLYRRGKYEALSRRAAPGLLFLDLNMPRKDGREALAEIRADPRLRTLPVVVMTTSKAEEDVLRSYNVGANSYITKPLSLQELVRVLSSAGEYWLQIVTLPRSQNDEATVVDVHRR